MTHIIVCSFWMNTQTVTAGWSLWGSIGLFLGNTDFCLGHDTGWCLQLRDPVPFCFDFVQNDPDFVGICLFDV